MSLSSSSSSSKASGGLKGFLQRASSSFLKAFDASKEYGSWFAHYGGQVGIFLASTSMVVLMPLIFEINREVMVRCFFGGDFGVTWDDFFFAYK